MTITTGIHANIKGIVMALAVSMMLTACSAQRSAVSTVQVTPASTTTNTGAATKADYAIVNRLATTYKTWQDVYVPVTFTLEAPKELSISGRMTMVRDKEIYISLRMLGFEVAQIYINNDEIWLVEKYHKYYYKESLAKMIGGYGITVGDMQDMLLGRAFIPGEGVLSPANIGSLNIGVTSQGKLKLSPGKPIKGCDWYFTVTRTEPPLLDGLTLPMKGGDIECTFANPVNSAAGIVSSDITISAPVKGTEVRAAVSIDTGSAKWDSGRAIDFKRPSSSYKMIDVPAMLENLGN